MPTIASRDLRNHTAAVLEGVARGEVYLVTVHGRAVAEVRRAPDRRRSGVPLVEVLELLDRQALDPTLADDLHWITQGSTDELGSPASAPPG